MFAISNKSPRGPIEVLLTDGHTRATLAVARSYARRGVSVIVLCPRPQSMAFYSRDVKHAVSSPEPASQPDAFLRLLLELIQKHEIRLAVPMTDKSLVLFERHRDDLEQHTRLAMARSQALRRVLNKRDNLELARELGVPCPRQFLLEDRRQIPEMIQALGFPIVIKRSSDPIELGAPQFKSKVLYAFNESELRLYIDQYCLNGERPLFQECATGKVHDLCCFAVRGELLAVHEYHAIRRSNGCAVLRKVVRPSPDLVEHTRNLLAALDWDGVAHVSFFIGENGQKWYMETNARFWASVEGSVYAGWDFPLWTYEYFINGRRPQPGPITLGSSTCWHTGDLLALLKFVAGKGEIPTPGTTPGKLRAAWQFLSGFRPGIHSDIFRWYDPLPAIVEFQPYFDRVIRVMQRDAWSYSKAMQIMFPLSSSSPNHIRPLNERGTGLEGKETGAPLNADAGAR
jgi:predicted ATP-grasp superfamily ATP-dependent carboligase